MITDEKEIRNQISTAQDSNNKGSKWPAMTYEDGVIAALEWILEDMKSAPMEGE